MDIQYLKARNGGKTLKIDNYYIHSRYEPEKEAVEIIEQLYKKECLHIFFGFGVGHFVQAYREKVKDIEGYILIEPILDNIPDDNVYYLNDNTTESELSKYLLNHIKVTDRINIILSPNYDRLVPEKYLKFLNTLKEVQKLLIINENTINYFTGIWDKNYLLNTVHSVQDKSLLVLRQNYNGPVVIASAGPSLTKQLPIIKRYRDQIILISAGSAINSLLNSGIEPDYTVSIDGSELNYEHYKNLKLPNSVLIYDMFSHPEIRPIFKNGFYFINHLKKEVNQHFSNVVNQDIAVLLGGVSVATFCLSIAQLITSGPVALIGQDLAYTNNQSHAEGNIHLKKIDNQFKEKTKLIEEVGYYDDIITTSYDLVAMKRVFEQLIDIYGQNGDIFNCTEGGIKLDGYRQMPFTQFCVTYTDQKVEKKYINNSLDEKEAKLMELKGKLTDELQICKELQRLCDECIKELQSNKSTLEFSAKTLKKLDKNDKKINKIIGNTALSITFASINLYVIKYFKAAQNESKEQGFARTNKQSEMLYSKMREATEAYILNLNETINNIIEMEN